MREFKFSEVDRRLSTDPVWHRVLALARERSTLLSASKLANLYLILRCGLDGERNVIEFGSFRGGSAIFMASILRDLGSESKVFALDTYAGMPPTDATRDVHREGEFADCDYAGLHSLLVRQGLADQCLTIQGRFAETLPNLLSSGTRFARLLPWGI
jgi:hypothetical protein